MSHLDGQKLVAAKGLDDDVKASHDGEGLSQEIAVLNQLILRNISEGRELLLQFGMIGNEPVFHSMTVIKITFNAKYMGLIYFKRMAGGISPFFLALSQEERIRSRSLALRPMSPAPTVVESPLLETVVVEVVVVVVVVPGCI